MPFTYRDKPKLADRLRGKSGEEILNELKSDLDSQGRRMFFDSPSRRTRHSNSAFPRGFPFDDDRNRINIRTYLDEIASRHPEFADQLVDRTWPENFVEPSFNKSEAESQSNQGQSNVACGSTQKPCEEKEPPQNLSNFGLRNTVPLGPGANPEHDRHQRSMSAPPENRGGNPTKKFVSKCTIPVMNNPAQDPVQVKPDLAGRGPQEQPQQKANNAPNVRVIPIQVEGRDAPLVNTNVDFGSNFGGEAFTEPTFEGRLPRDFGSYQRYSPRFAHKERAATPPQYQYAPQYQQFDTPPQQFMPQQHYASQYPQYVPPSQHFMPQQHFAPHDNQGFAQQPQHPQKPPAPPPTQQHQPKQQQQQQPPPPQQQQQPQQQHQQQTQQPQQAQQPGSKRPQGDEVDSRPPQFKPEPVKDPIEKVQAIQKDVEELLRQVEAFKGNSRTDKQYLMLDELLTRQLLLLDVIDTEGKENVRQARKDTIRSIQRCISTLENKVPLVENNETKTESNQGEETNAEVPRESQPMNVDTTKENTPVDNKDSQKMEVDEQGSGQTQAQVQEPQQEQGGKTDNSGKI